MAELAESAFISINNWRRYVYSKLYETEENVRFGIWRWAVSPSDASEKRNMSTQLQSLTSRAQQPERYFGKYTSLNDFWCP